MKHVDIKTFGQELNKFRITSQARSGKKFNGKTIGKDLNIPHSTIYAYLNGANMPPRENLEAILTLLEATPDERAELRHLWEQAELNKWTRAEVKDMSPAPVVAIAQTSQTLPLAVPDFTGRGEEQRQLDQLAERAIEKSSTASVAAIVGTVGVGKTALAVNWAHATRDQFADGQLYLDLRGYSPDDAISPADALLRLLATLGIPQRDIENDLVGRIDQYQKLISTRRMVLILDNAKNADHVRDLLPNSSSCLTLVTSRDSLGGLVIERGATRIEVAPLSNNEAIELLEGLIGERVKTEPEAALELSSRCACLPLALRIAAEVAVFRQATALKKIVKELSDEQQALDVLDDSGDDRTALRVVFSWSYKQLSSQSADTFRLAGLHPSVEFDDYAIAALTDSSLRDAKKLGVTLSRAHLIYRTSSDRYSMHDLLRFYARECSNQEDSPATQADALGRLFDFYLTAASQATSKLYPQSQANQNDLPSCATPLPAFDEVEDAEDWIRVERSNVVSMSYLFSRYDWIERAQRLVQIMGVHLRVQAYHADSELLHNNTLELARQSGHKEAEAYTLDGLAGIYVAQGKLQLALDCLDGSLTLFQELEDLAGQALVLSHIGVSNLEMGNYPVAEESLEQALSIYYRLGNVDRQGIILNNLGILYERAGLKSKAIERYNEAYDIHTRNENWIPVADTLTNLGTVFGRNGDYKVAIGYLRRALILCRHHNHRHGEALCLVNLGLVTERLGRYSLSLGLLSNGLFLSREIGDRRHEALALANLGVLARELGDFDTGIQYVNEGLAVSRASQSGITEVQCLNTLGELLLAKGDSSAAASTHDKAKIVAIEINTVGEQMRALKGLGECSVADGDIPTARAYWLEALTLPAEGNEQEKQIREKLAQIS